MASKFRTFYIDKNHHGVLTEVTTALLQEVGQEGGFLTDLEIVNFGGEVLQLNVVYKTQHSRTLLTAHPPAGAIIEDEIRFDHATFLFSDEVEPASYSTGTFAFDGTGLDTTEIVTESGNNAVQIRLPAVTRNVSGLHTLKINATGLEYIGNNPIQHGDILAYNMHDQSAPLPGQSIPYTAGLPKLGEIEIQGIRIDKSSIPSERVDKYLGELGVGSERLLHFSSVDISETLVYVVFAYYRTLEPYLVQTFPYNNSVFIFGSNPKNLELVFVFLEEVDAGYITSNDGLFKLYSSFGVATPIEASKVTVDPGGKTVRVDVESVVTAADIYDFRITGLLSNDGTFQTRDIVYTLQVLGYANTVGTIDVAAIDHDSLGGFETHEHINWGHPYSGFIYSGNFTSGSVTQFTGNLVYLITGHMDHNTFPNYVSEHHVDWGRITTGNIHSTNITEGSVTQHQGAISHNSLDGTSLTAGDPHTQYHTEARADARSNAWIQTKDADSFDDIVYVDGPNDQEYLVWIDSSSQWENRVLPITALQGGQESLSGIVQDGRTDSSSAAVAGSTYRYFSGNLGTGAIWTGVVDVTDTEPSGTVGRLWYSTGTEQFQIYSDTGNKWVQFNNLTGHTGDTSTHGVGTIVGLAETQTLTNKTLTTPTIGDFTNSTHDHSNNAGGGQLSLSGTSDFGPLFPRHQDGLTWDTGTSKWGSSGLFTGHSGDTSIHFTEASIDHGSIAGLGDDDHTIYVKVDGSRAMSAGLTVVGSAPQVKFSDVSTDNATKKGFLVVPSYDTDEENVAAIYLRNTNGVSKLSFGGGDSSVNASTAIGFYVAASLNTAQGTELIRIKSTGMRIGGAGNPTATCVLDLGSVSDKTFLPPKGTTSNRDAISQEVGSVYYNTTTNKLQCHNGTSWQDCF